MSKKNEKLVLTLNVDSRNQIERIREKIRDKRKKKMISHAEVVRRALDHYELSIEK